MREGGGDHSPREWRVGVGGDETRVLFEASTRGGSGVVFVCAHGAGGHMHDRSMENLAAALRECGLDIVRFNFLYREQGARRPDPMPRLKACMQAVIEHMRTVVRPQTLVIGGRSMGGRTASMLAAEGTACDGLALFAYPLHPAGRPEKLRVAHLADIAVPVLCFNGTRDTLCRQDLMEQTVNTLGANWRMHWLEGADHSFHVLKSFGRTDADVLKEVANATEAWIPEIRREQTR